jgi:CheY-like chemotaxis protein
VNSVAEKDSAPCPLRALVADDDAEMLDLVASALRQDGLIVAEATDGRELVRLVDAGPLPDIVITDVHMPGMSGLDALSHIHKCHPEIPVVLMSSFATARVCEQAQVNGPAAAVLSKPFELARLRDVVARQTHH